MNQSIDKRTSETTVQQTRNVARLSEDLVQTVNHRIVIFVSSVLVRRSEKGVDRLRKEEGQLWEWRTKGKTNVDCSASGDTISFPDLDGSGVVLLGVMVLKNDDITEQRTLSESSVLDNLDGERSVRVDSGGSEESGEDVVGDVRVGAVDDHVDFLRNLERVEFGAVVDKVRVEGDVRNDVVGEEVLQHSLCSGEGHMDRSGDLKSASKVYSVLRRTKQQRDVRNLSKGQVGRRKDGVLGEVLVLREGSESFGEQSLRSTDGEEILSESDLLDVGGEGTEDGREDEEVVEGRERREERSGDEMDYAVLGDDGVSSLLDDCWIRQQMAQKKERANVQKLNSRMG